MAREIGDIECDRETQIMWSWLSIVLVFGLTLSLLTLIWFMVMTQRKDEAERRHAALRLQLSWRGAKVLDVNTHDLYLAAADTRSGMVHLAVDEDAHIVVLS